MDKHQPKKYTNRYGDIYWFEQISDDAYLFKMDGAGEKYARWGGHEGEHGIDTNNLGMYDPSGGPYMYIGYTFKPRNTGETEKVKHIKSTEQGVVFTVERNK